MEGRIKVFSSIIGGVLLTYLINIIFILLYALVLAKTNVAESTMPTVIFVINLIGILISSSITSIKIGQNGMKYGAFIGLIYIMILYILGSCSVVGLTFNTYSLATIIFSVLIGSVGGIIGVNLVKN